MEKNQKTKGFRGFVLLSDPEWDKSALKARLEENIAAKTSENGDEIKVAAEGFSFTLKFAAERLRDPMAELYARANHLWIDAADTVRAHKAYIEIIADPAEDLIALGTVFVKICCEALAEKNASALYHSGAVYEPDFYFDCAETASDGSFPILDLVWFGLYGDGEQSGYFTSGLRDFGKDELEVYAPADKVDFDAVRDFIVGAAAYVIAGDITLQNGETIGFSDDEQFSITISEGIAVAGNSAKISFT